MTIKELCNKHLHCGNCPFVKVCPYYDFWDMPLNKLNDSDSEQITNAIIETAKLLQEDKK